MEYVSKILKTLPKETLIDESINKTKLYTLDDDKDKITLTKEKDRFILDGVKLRQVVRNTNFEERESLYYLHRKLKELGVNKMLQEAGVKPGDTVVLYDYELEWEE